MAITYTWTIPTTERNLSDGGVTVAHWRCSAVDGDYSASSYGTCGFTPDASAGGFISYDSLTEANVLGWVQGSVSKDDTEAALAAKINADKTPTTGTGVPW
tara:strand:+ start:661 stop:963 length:303 start_codon:yes stop_codon:yes gene_type:complete